MGPLQAVEPVVGEEGVGPASMVRPATAAFPLHPLAEQAPQAHPDPAVEPLERPLVAVLEIFKPAPERRVEAGDDREEATAGGTLGLLPDRLLELGQALRARAASAVLEPVTQE